MLNAVIFDLDGTLVDSEPIWEKVLERMVEPFGKTFDRDFHKTLLGTVREETLRRVIEHFDLPATVEQLVPLYDPVFIELSRAMPPTIKPGADALLRALVTAGIPVALATGSRRVIVGPALKAHGWEAMFNAVVCGDDVVNGKPAPDVYQQAARLLDCTVDTCLAIEDATNGIASAKSAGMNVLAVSDPCFNSDLSAADRIVSSLEHVTIDDLKSLIM